MTTHKLSNAKFQTSDVYNTNLAGMKLRTNPSNFEKGETVNGGLKKIDGMVTMVKDVVRGNEKQNSFDVFDGPEGCDTKLLPKTIPNVVTT